MMFLTSLIRSSKELGRANQPTNLTYLETCFIGLEEPQEGLAEDYCREKENAYMDIEIAERSH